MRHQLSGFPQMFIFYESSDFVMENIGFIIIFFSPQRTGGRGACAENYPSAQPLRSHILCGKAGLFY
jgi:hypothetical protein